MSLGNAASKETDKSRTMINRPRLRPLYFEARRWKPNDSKASSPLLSIFVAVDCRSDWSTSFLLAVICSAKRKDILENERYDKRWFKKIHSRVTFPGILPTRESKYRRY
jgi:hypothetical protein